jgi:alanyl-tRNA synthetase
MMGDVFPELKDNEKKIQDIIRDEEESFENTLAKVILDSRRICSTIATVESSLLKFYTGRIFACRRLMFTSY